MNRRRSRAYIRGWTPLGLSNTLLATVCNRLIVSHRDWRTLRWVGFDIVRASDFDHAERYRDIVVFLQVRWHFKNEEADDGR